jgi:branched-subunit amino acid aminotransferase/4-amino-4-deoxychorismate lyase
MPTPKVWINGRVVPSEQAVVSVHDRAFRSGEGVFETLRIYGSHPFRAGAHVERAVAGAAAIGLRLDPEVLHRGLREVVAANGDVHAGADSVVRLTASAGEIDPDSYFPGAPASGGGGQPTVVATSHRLRVDASLTERGVRAVCVPLARELPEVKAVSYLVALTARRHAAAHDVEEALLTSPEGTVLEAASANLAVVTGDVLATPPVGSGLLAGVTRAVVLEVAHRAGLRVEQRALHRDELHRCDEAVLTASTREIVPLVEVDGRPVGSGRPGPAAARLLDAYHEEVERERRDGGVTRSTGV